jgi:hypothetical protein
VGEGLLLPGGDACLEHLRRQRVHHTWGAGVDCMCGAGGGVGKECGVVSSR